MAIGTCLWKDKSEDRSPEVADSVHKAPSKVKSRHSGSKGPRPKATSRISEGVEVGVIYDHMIPIPRSNCRFMITEKKCYYLDSFIWILDKFLIFSGGLIFSLQILGF